MVEAKLALDDSPVRPLQRRAAADLTGAPDRVIRPAAIALTFWLRLDDRILTFDSDQATP